MVNYVLELTKQRSEIEQIFTWLWVTAALSLSLLYLISPDGYFTFIVTSGGMLVVAALSLAYPSVLLYFILATSVFSSILRNADSVTVGSTTVSLSGLRWIWVGAIVIAVLAINFRRVQFKGPYYWLLIFSGWVMLRWMGTPSGIGLRDVLFYSLPVLLAVYTSFLLATTSSDLIGRTRWLLLCTAAIPAIAYAILIPAGLVTLEDIGPEGIIDPRAISEYLLVVLCVAASQWRYGATAKSRKHGLAISILCLATTVLTLSRAATFVGMILMGFAQANVWQFRKIVFAVTTAAVFLTAVVWFVPTFRNRFTGQDGAFSEEFPYINTEGRAFFWAVTIEHAIEKPVIGWGPGSARLLVGAAIPDSEYEEYHPHNEYLQVFHDLGLVGLVLMLLGWVPLLRVHWRRWRASDALGDNMAAQWHMSALLALAVVLLSSTVGNTLHEAYITAPTLILSACAFSYARSMQTHARQGSA